MNYETFNEYGLIAFTLIAIGGMVAAWCLIAGI